MVHLGTTIDMNRKQSRDQSAITELRRHIASDIHVYESLCEIENHTDVSFDSTHTLLFISFRGNIEGEVLTFKCIDVAVNAV